MVRLLEELSTNLPISQKRELFEELMIAYNSSSSNHELYYDLLNQYSELLDQLNYQDRLASLSDVKESTRKRHNYQEATSIILNDTKGHLSKLKKGKGAWVGVNFFTEWNYTRLLGLRLKRLADAISTALGKENFTKNIDKSNPALSVLGILWYLPRFLRNTALMINHTKNSGELDYARKHAFEWFNDLAWISTGSINFGISTGLYLKSLAGILGPGGIYLTVGLYGFDILNQGIKSYQKIQKINRILKNIDTNLQQKTSEIKMIDDSINQVSQKLNKLYKHRQYFQDHQEVSESNRINLHIDRLKHKYQQLIESSNKLKTRKDQLEETRNRIKATKRYTQREQWSKLGIASGLFIGMATSLFAPIIGASIVLATCAIQYYLTHYYLPKEEVRLSFDPIELLHNRLLQHCEKQQNKLQKQLIKLKYSSNQREKTLNKIDAYDNAYQVLTNWQSNDNYQELVTALNIVIKASQMTRKLNITSESEKDLKNILKDFDTLWVSEKYKKPIKNDSNLTIENAFKNSIGSFIDSKPIKPANIIHNYHMRRSNIISHILVPT